MRTASRLILPGSLSLVLVAGCDDQTPLDPEFQAASAPAANLTATAVSFDRIALAWSDDVKNEVGWEVHRSTTGPTGDFGAVQMILGNASSATDAGLQQQSQYCYKVRSFRMAARRMLYGAFTNVACATTPGPPLLAPSNLDARPLNHQEIGVYWVDNSLSETGFRVERAASESGPWSLLAIRSQDATGLSDLVSTEQRFCYRVYAFNATGDTEPSNTDCTAVPAGPTQLGAVVTVNDVELTWIDNSGVEDGFTLRRMGVHAITSISLPPNTTRYRDADAPDDTYSYTVLATREGASSLTSNSVQVVVATSPPTAPWLGGSLRGSTTVSVSWGNPQTEEGFRLERSFDGGNTWALIAVLEMNRQGYIDYSGLSPETEVCYRLFAFNSVGDSPPSNVFCLRPLAAPTNFTATAVSSDIVGFGWRDNSAFEEGYQVLVYICWDEQSCFLSPIVELAANTTSYRYESPGAAAGMIYAVIAFSSHGGSDYADAYVYPAGSINARRASPAGKP